MRKVHSSHLTTLNDKKLKASALIQRDWIVYSKTKLCEKLAGCDRSIEDDNVQYFWNSFENKLINVVDDILLVVRVLYS